MNNSEAAPRPSRATLIGRALRLRCPVCGVGKLFRYWFIMPRCCEHCQFQYEREPGYFLGSIYINYGVTSLLMTIGYFLAFFNHWLPAKQLLWLAFGFTLVFPLVLFPHSRALWLAFDLAWDPPSDAERKFDQAEETIS